MTETAGSTLTLIWGLIGLALLAAEMMTLTFILLFFGLSALIVAAVRLTGVDILALDLALFALIGAAGIFFFRPRIREAVSKRQGSYEVDKNATFILSADIAPRGSSSVLYQGTTWTAVNATEQLLTTGQTVRVTKVEGIKIHVMPADG